MGPAAAFMQTTPPPAPQRAGSAGHGLAVTFGAPADSLCMSQPHMALAAVTGAAETDPLQAALDAVFAAVVTYGEDYPALLEEIWSACGGRT